MPLSPAETAAIGKSWAVIYGASKDKNGDDFLIKLFTAYPNNANFFGDFKGKSLGDIKASPQVRQVSSRIMNRLNEFVQAAGDAGKLNGLLDAFAEKHVTYGVRHQQYEDVIGIFESYLQDAAGDKSSFAAWKNLFTQLIAAFKKVEAKQGL